MAVKNLFWVLGYISCVMEVVLLTFICAKTREKFDYWLKNHVEDWFESLDCVQNFVNIWVCFNSVLVKIDRVEFKLVLLVYFC